MATQKERMLAGQPYQAEDPELARRLWDRSEEMLGI